MRLWPITAVLLAFPLAAAAHHLIFYRPYCMLGEMGPDYDLATIAIWLQVDPSPYVAGIAATLVYAAGRRWPELIPPSVAFLLAALPYTIFIWDIPGTGRTVHEFL